eukprot:g37519.t1
MPVRSAVARSNIQAHQQESEKAQMIHTGEKPFKYAVCDYKCKHSSHLKTHMRTCRGDFKCSAILCAMTEASSGTT